MYVVAGDCILRTQAVKLAGALNFSGGEHVSYGSLAAAARPDCDVRFAAESGHEGGRRAHPLRANYEHQDHLIPA